MGLFSLLGLSRPSRQPAESSESKCSSLRHAGSSGPPTPGLPHAPPLDGVDMGRVLSRCLPQGRAGLHGGGASCVLSCMGPLLSSPDISPFPPAASSLPFDVSSLCQ